MTVVNYKHNSYPQKSVKIINQISKFRIPSAQKKEWICRTCHLSLKKGEMPALCKANKLEVMSLPHEMGDLNSQEVRLISKRIAFMKIVGLPRGKQNAIHGPAVNVPSKVHDVCSLFPRLPSELQTVPLKLKRRFKYKSHYMYDFVRPSKVLDALRWLKTNNQLYRDIEINESWQDNARNDDPELWQTMTLTLTAENDAQDRELASENVRNILIGDEANSYVDDKISITRQSGIYNAHKLTEDHFTDIMVEISHQTTVEPSQNAGYGI